MYNIVPEETWHVLDINPKNKDSYCVYRLFSNFEEKKQMLSYKFLVFKNQTENAEVALMSLNLPQNDHVNSGKLEY